MSDVEAPPPAGYHGWKNYETWAVHLWISNDQGTHERYLDEADEQYRDAILADLDGDREQWTEAAARALAEVMEDDIDNDDACPVLAGSSVYTDLLRAALAEVDWFEVAAAYVEDIDRNEIEKDERPADDQDDAEEPEPDGETDGE